VVLAALCVVGCDSGNHQAQTPADTTADITTSGSPVPAVYTPGKAAARSQPGSAEDLVPGTFRIDFFGTEVSILANGVNEMDILSRLANQAGFELADTGATWKVVTLNIAAASVHAALVQLLKPHQYQIIYEFDNKRQADILKRVVVNARGDSEKRRKRDTGSGLTARFITKRGYPDGNFTGSGVAPSEKQQIGLNQLLDPSAKRRAEAAENIEATGTALDYLTQLLVSDPSPEVRAAAAHTLADSEDPRAMDALITALEDQDVSVLVEVIDALGFAGNKATINRLQPFLEHSDEDVRDAAESAIELLE
jgi:HEAT repeats